MLTNEDFYQIKQLNTNTQCVNILKKLFHKISFSLNFHKYMNHHHHLLDQYLTDNNYHSQSQKVIRGKINEYLILLYFQNKGIIHLYPQAYLFFIPDIKFDLVLFTKTKRIIAFNFKTCLRDRYKQAMIEAQQLKKLDTRFEFYLLTNNTVETQRLNKKINQG
ncbi:predicted membrane protein, partial ['Chrysanthemum coronarium' phytoplasma]